MTHTVLVASWCDTEYEHNHAESKLTQASR